MILRREVGWCVAQAYAWTGARRRALAACRAEGVELPLVFHAATADEVRAVVGWLVARGVRPWLSFDDGWRETLAAVQVLEEFDLRATVFIAPGEIARGCVWTNDAMRLGVDAATWRGWYALPAAARYARLDAARAEAPAQPRRLMTEGEVRALARHPRVEIGNHTWSHLSATSRPEAEVLAEVDRAQRVLADWCGGRAPRTFAYPFGRGTPALDAALRARGLTPFYARPGRVTAATRGAARNMAYEGMSVAENLGRVLGAWPRIGETR